MCHINKSLQHAKNMHQGHIPHSICSYLYVAAKPHQSEQFVAQEQLPTHTMVIQMLMFHTHHQKITIQRTLNEMEEKNQFNTLLFGQDTGPLSCHPSDQPSPVSNHLSNYIYFCVVAQKIPTNDKDRQTRPTAQN